MEKKLVKSLLKKVRDDYNTIAKEWNEKRSQVRPLRALILKRIPARARVLDVGCGNGIVYEFLAQKSIAYTGVDMSGKLIAIARRRAKAVHGKSSCVFKVASALRLPFKDASFTHVLCMAVLHHIPGQEARARVMSELYRVLKPGGEVQVTVWNLFSDYAEEKFHIVEQCKAASTVGYDANDVHVPWRATANKVVERYMHAFTRDELYALAKAAGFKKIRIILYDKDTQRPTTVHRAENLTLIATR